MPTLKQVTTYVQKRIAKPKVCNIEESCRYACKVRLTEGSDGLVLKARKARAWRGAGGAIDQEQ